MLILYDLPDVLVFFKWHLFADDVQIYLNEDWFNVKARTEENKLILNAGKSKASSTRQLLLFHNLRDQLPIGEFDASGYEECLYSFCV